MKVGLVFVIGNIFIFKFFEKIFFFVFVFGFLIKEVGFFLGVFQIFIGDGSIGVFFVNYMKVNKISFIGFIVIGCWIQECVVKSNFKCVIFEFGGKSFVVVFDDCDFDNVVNWCVNVIIVNIGQVCFVVSCVYV